MLRRSENLASPQTADLTKSEVDINTSYTSTLEPAGGAVVKVVMIRSVGSRCSPRDKLRTVLFKVR